MNDVDVLLTFCTFLAAAVAGHILHWGKRKFRGHTVASYVEYLYHEKEATIRTFQAIFVAVIGLTAQGMDTVTIQSLSMAFMAGYSLDSMFNTFPEDKPN